MLIRYGSIENIIEQHKQMVPDPEGKKMIHIKNIQAKQKSLKQSNVEEIPAIKQEESI